jgi:WD40 repeat protein
VGTGKATVTLSMEWKGTSIESTKHVLNVVAPQGGTDLPVSKRLVRSLPHPDKTANVWGVRFMPDGKLFTAGYPSGVVQLWDVGTGKEVRRIDSPRGYRGSAEYAMTPADYKTLYVPMDNRKAHRIENDEKRRFRIEYNGEVLVWDLRTGKPKASLKPSKGRGVMSASVSPDGKRLITAERLGYATGEEPPPDVTRMYDLSGDRSWDLGEGYVSAAFSADSKLVYLAQTVYQGKKSSTLKVIDVEGKAVATLGEMKGEVNFYGPQLSPDGKRLVVTVSKGRINEPGAVRVYDLSTKKVAAEFTTGGDFPFLSPRFSPDGKRLVAGDYKGRLSVYDVQKKALVRRHEMKKGMAMGFSLAFDKEGKRLAVPVRIETDEDRDRDPDPLDLPQPRVLLFDLTKEADPEEIVCPHGWNGGVAFSPDGKTLAVGGAGAVHLFDVSKPAK